MTQLVVPVALLHTPRSYCSCYCNCNCNCTASNEQSREGRHSASTMAVIQTALIWIAYAVAVVILACVASIFVYTYQKPGDRSAIVSIVSIITLTSLLATVLLLPVDIALVSSTTSSRFGRKKDWATPERVHHTLQTLKIVYYTLYSWDALLCLIVVPFTYFLYEEQEDGEDGDRSVGSKLWGAFKYTIAFILLVVILFLVGFFVPPP